MKIKRGKLKVFNYSGDLFISCLTQVDKHNDTSDLFKVISIICPNCYYGEMEDKKKCPVCLGKDQVFVLQNYKEKAVIVNQKEE